VAKTSGNAWIVQEYVLETQGTYPKRVCFEVFGEERIKEFDIKVMDLLTVSFDIDAREYNGRWFNSLRAWKVEREVLPTPSTVVTAPAPSPLPPINDLPWETNDVAIKDYPF
jgi:hypothetical protein